MRIIKIILLLCSFIAVEISCANPSPGLSSSKSITAFSFASPAIAGTIDENAKTITVSILPYGTIVNALVATFTTTGKSVKVNTTLQVSGVTSNDFTNPVVYTITAEDGSSVNYTVIVIVQLFSDYKAITAFSFASPAIVGTINENAKTITVGVLPYGTNVTALIAAFTTTGVNVKVNSVLQVSGETANDFTNPVVYTVTAEDGTSVDYIVTVIIQPWHVIGNAGFTSDAVYYYSFAINPVSSEPYLAFSDLSQAGDATVMKYSGGSWQVVGWVGFSSAPVSPYISLAFDPSGNPYVAYQDGGEVGKITVKNYVSSTWQTVGTAGFSDGVANYISLSINSSGTPYVAYSDVSNSNKLTVKAFTGGSWQVVGTPSFSDNSAKYISLAINSSGTPYVAYQDKAYSYKVTVKQFTGGTWQDVGSPGFSEQNADYVSLAINAGETPYVGYGRPSVMKYTDGSWQFVGPANFSEGVSTSLVLDSFSIPYVVIIGPKATVMMYKDDSWQVFGLPFFSEGDAVLPQLAIDSSDNIYIAFQDGANSLKGTVMRYK